MISFWLLLGQALLDTNFRRYKILTTPKGETNEKALNSDQMTLAKYHDRINKMPGRYPLSRFELKEIKDLFSKQPAVNAAVKVCEQWHEFCKARGLYPQPSVEFRRAIGLAASDTRWVKKIATPDANNPTEYVDFDLSGADRQCLFEFLNWSTNRGQPTHELLKKFEEGGWSPSCPTSVTLDREYGQ